MYFDITHTYNVSGALTNARDLILIGSGAKIKSDNLINYYIQIAPKVSGYNGKYNTYSESDLLFKVAAMVLHNKVVNLTVWGDSIRTGSFDMLGVTYNNAPSTVKYSPGGLTAGDAYIHRLIAMLTNRFKDVTFNFYNRTIPTTLITEWQDNKTFNGVTKTWIEHVKDTAPDILIINFGMNSGSIAIGKEFTYRMNQITDYISTNFTQKTIQGLG